MAACAVLSPRKTKRPRNESETHCSQVILCSWFVVEPALAHRAHSAHSAGGTGTHAWLRLALPSREFVCFRAQRVRAVAGGRSELRLHCWPPAEMRKYSCSLQQFSPFVCPATGPTAHAAARWEPGSHPRLLPAPRPLPASHIPPLVQSPRPKDPAARVLVLVPSSVFPGQSFWLRGLCPPAAPHSVRPHTLLLRPQHVIAFPPCLRVALALHGHLAVLREPARVLPHPSWRSGPPCSL